MNIGDRWTVTIIPHSTKKVRQLSLSAYRLIFVLGVLLLGLVVGAGFALGYYQAKREVAKLNYVKAENVKQASRVNDLQAEINQSQKELAQVRDKLGQINELEKKVRGMAGLPGGTGSGGTPGGGQLPSRGGLVERAAQMNADLSRRVGELQSLEGQLRDHLAYMASIPSAWPVSGTVTSGFGWRPFPFGGRQEFHDGLDISAPEGTPVTAAGSGRVAFAGWSAGYGNLVIIDHGNGFRTYYGHNSALLVKTGQQVERGQVISRVGSTGLSTGPHVHFGMEKDGQFVDPMRWLQ
ncbi:hypothetical protein A6M21_12925 [Desulfotomaculum copahuensis]|uniref:M23ase beta-sheet core domain-containing protein n=1 Tax=Desulfotomaculum copahuensis TaxID=1838280 RepID=A0A1B7LCT7_9FIRM|nr:hypothetical protein A6M21_12925 [Desulfotomaculum copahuensis]